MSRRQTVPSQWLILDRFGSAEERLVRRLPQGSGILAISRLGSRDERRLRHLAFGRKLELCLEDSGGARRVHDIGELRRALLQRIPLILLSPVFLTSSHADWLPLPRMRAAALARLGRRKLVALGGMDARKYALVKDLGFRAWAGISAFRT